MEITIRNESIVRVDCDAIVNPANSFGYMGGGVAKVIKATGGDDIEEEAIAQAPVEIGTALATSAGELKCSAIIHAPTVRDPSDKADVNCVEEATRAALELADEMQFKKIAMSGVGTGVGGVPHGEAAGAMMSVIKEFEAENLEELVLVDIDEEMVDAWNASLE